MLAVNCVLVFMDGDRIAERVVVLYLSSDGRFFWGLDLDDPKAWPRPYEVAGTVAGLEDGSCLMDRPMSSAAMELSACQIAVRDERWAAIRDFVSREPDIFDPDKRFAMVKEISEVSGWVLNTSRAMLQRYWRGGKTPSALLPAFNRRGGVGIMREPGERKLGRPRSINREQTGVNVSREVRRAIVALARAQFRRDGKRQLTTVYRAWLDTFFMEDDTDEEGRTVRVPRSEFATTGLPTLAQFKHTYYALADIIEARRERNPRRFALNYRPLTGTATAETWGPGSRFLIDATMADIYLVSRDNRSRIVGRPVIYVVIDVWSRLIVGLYVAIEDASWTSAMMALANAACSKVAFCAEHGIEIVEDEWPAANIGARLLSDKGEVDGKTAENLALHFNRVLEAAAAYRGDLKGLVETQFNTLQVQFGQFAPGYVAKDYGKRGTRDYRLDAVLDIHEFTATMIDLVLARNSATLRNYDRDQGMPGDVVPLSPIELWHWGMAHRSGRSQAWPEDYVRFRLLPTATVTVDRRGIRFQGRSYVGKAILRLMSKARMGKSERVTISFDPRVTDVVYLHDAAAEHGFEICDLHEASRAYGGRTCTEADQDRQFLDARRYDGETKDVTKSINVDKRLQDRVRDAAARKPKDDRPKSHKVADIRDNRHAEKERAKVEQGNTFRLGGRDGMLGGKVVPFALPTPDDFSESRLTDFMGD